MYHEYHLDVEQESVWLLSNGVPFENPPPFWVNEVGCFIAKPGYATSHGNRDGYVLLYSVQGEGELYYRGKKHSLPAGHAAFVQCTDPHEYHLAPGCRENWKFYWMHVEASSCAYYFNTMFRQGFSVLACQDVESIEAAFADIVRLFDQPQVCGYSQISHHVSSILTQLVALRTDQQRRNTLHMNAIEETVRYIKTHYQESIDVDFLADKAGLSKYYYIKLFKEIMYATPYEYVLGVRITEAKKLLLATDLKSSEIGSLVGFADECNFSRTFKRLTGITPIQYRKNA